MRRRTTVRLDSDLVAEAGKVAESSGGNLPTFRGRGTRPGVNLDDSAALIERMEGDRDALLRRRAPRRRR
jgi:hypothetical protein